MKEQFEIFVIPSTKFGPFYFCPIRSKESHLSEPAESIVAADLEKMLSPSESRMIISRIHANNLFSHARKILTESKFYIYSIQDKNFVFSFFGQIQTEGDAYKTAKEIEKTPKSFSSNEIFEEKVIQTY